ncbi:MAG: hypothetical protein ACKOUR_18655, partial [Planctomycetota bacterium]
LIPSPYSPTGKKKTRLARATSTLFSCGGEGSTQQTKRESQKETPFKGRTAYADAATFAGPDGLRRYRYFRRAGRLTPMPLFFL